jgi:hypothetical protein
LINWCTLFAYLYRELMLNNRTQHNWVFFSFFFHKVFDHLLMKNYPQSVLTPNWMSCQFWNKPVHCHISLKYMIWRIKNKIVILSCSLMYTSTHLLFHVISVTSTRQTNYVHNSIYTLLRIHYAITDIIIHNWKTSYFVVSWIAIWCENGT